VRYEERDVFELEGEFDVVFRGVRASDGARPDRRAHGDASSLP
jgi:hypothetical protein